MRFELGMLIASNEFACYQCEIEYSKYERRSARYKKSATVELWLSWLLSRNGIGCLRRLLEPDTRRARLIQDAVKRREKRSTRAFAKRMSKKIPNNGWCIYRGEYVSRWSLPSHAIGVRPPTRCSR
jgi:hypothetical protein